MRIELSNLLIWPGVYLVRRVNKQAAHWWFRLVSPAVVALRE